MVEKARGTRSSNTIKISKQSATWVGLIIAILLVVFWIGPALKWWGAAQAPSPTTIEFNVVDYASGEVTDESEDIQIALYKCDISDMTADEIADLTYPSYAVDKNYTHGEDFTPDFTTYDYWIYYTGEDFVWNWEHLSSTDLGTKTINAMNMTEDMSVLAYTRGAFTTTLASTDYDEWTVGIRSLDGSEGTTSNITTTEGYITNYDFVNNYYNKIVLRVEYNTTAATNYASLNTLFDYDENCVSDGSNNYTYFEIDAPLLGTLDVDMNFGSTLGSTFEVVGIAVGYGNRDSFTSLDTQT